MKAYSLTVTRQYCDPDADLAVVSELERVSDQINQNLLKPMSVATFHATVFADLKALGIEVAIDNMPNEIQDAIAFTEDKVHHAYDRDATHRFWRILLSSHFALSQFRTAFLGKVIPAWKSAFASGIVDSRRLVFYGSIVVLPLFVTVRAVDAWRWG